MSRRHRPTRSRASVTPSAESARVLRRDSGYPDQAKAAMLLLRRGGKATRQVCLVCGTRGVYQDLWLPAAVLAPVPDATARPTPYWTCARHHGTLREAAVATLLRRREGRTSGPRPSRCRGAVD